MSQITIAQFDELLEQQKQNSRKKWTDLEKNKVYTIDGYDFEDGPFGESMYLMLSDDIEVWAPHHLRDKIKRAVTRGHKLPFYVRPLGLRPCEQNKKHKYHAYDLVVTQ